MIYMQNKLYKIIDELNQHKRTRDDLELYYITTRLDRSLQTYIKELDNTSRLYKPRTK